MPNASPGVPGEVAARPYAGEPRVIQRVLEVTSRYNMFAPGQTVGVGVSGGADSVALLYILLELAPRWNLKLKVLHVNHQLRGQEAEADEEFVRALARELGLPVVVRRVDLGAGIGPGSRNLEELARKARYGFFSELLRSGEVDRVSLGHTLSDQAETVLFRLFRGSGPGGLAAIRPVTREGIVRPLILVSREEIRSFLVHRGVCWREDSSNEDLRLARNRLRRQLIPQLEREWNPQLQRVLAQLALLVYDEEEYWREKIEELAQQILWRDGPEIVLRKETLAQLPRAVGRRLLRWSIEAIRGDLRRVEFSHVEALFWTGVEGLSRRVNIPGVEAVWSCGWLRLARPGEPAGTQPYCFVVAGAGRWRLPGSRVELVCELEPAGRGYLLEKQRYNEGWWCLDFDRVGGKLKLRNWQPGDQFRPQGCRQPHKLKELFQRAGIPCWVRASWPMLVNEEGTIVWTRKFGVAAGFDVTSQTARILRVREEGLPAWLNQILGG